LNSSDDDLESRCKNEGNIKPKIVYFKTQNAQLDKIIEMINNARMDDVGILFRYNSEIQYAAEYFENRGLAVEMKINQNMEIDFNSTKPKLLTYHSSKGTQFQNVFIPIYADLRDDYESALYVAMTRTYEGLYIFHSQYKPSVLDELPSNIYESTISSAKKFEL